MKAWLRLYHIAQVTRQHGLWHDVAPSTPWRWRWLRWIPSDPRLSAQPQAVRIRLCLETLGPIFIKFGQMLSTRPDILSPELATELTKLQDQVPPFAWSQVEQRLQQAFAQPLQQVFSSFDTEPIASASVAQVHFAVLPSGEEVAVKILRPHIEQRIEQDLRLLEALARIVQRIPPDGPRLRPVEVVAEFRRHLTHELDLRREAANASQLRRNFEHSTMLKVPKIHWDYCSTHVMVMERMHGIPINQMATLDAMNIDRPTLARYGVEIFFTQVFRHSFFHADMHPGNILVAPEGQYIALDFGIMGTLTDTDKHYLAVNFLAFFHRDYRKVAEVHLESGWVPADTPVQELEMAVRTVCEPIFSKPLAEISLGKVLMQLFHISREYHVPVQPQLVLLQKTLLNIEGLGRELDPNLDLWETALPFLERWMKEQLGPRATIKRWLQEAPYWLHKVPAWPRKLEQALQHNPTETVLLPAYRRLLRELRWQSWAILAIAIVLMVLVLKLQ